MTNFDLYKLLNFIVGKDVYAKAIPEDIFNLELKAKNLRHFRKRLGLPETYAPGMIGVDATRLTAADIMPFRVHDSYANAAGKVALTDWYYISDYYSASSSSAEIISDQEVSSRIRNALTAPSSKHLVAYLIKEGLSVLPTTVTPITVIWYRKPKEPVFVTKVNETTLELEYDANNSIELEWDDGSKLDILHMILADFGYNTTRTDVSQYAQKLIETGK